MFRKMDELIEAVEEYMDISCCALIVREMRDTVQPNYWVLADPSAESVSENKDCRSYQEH